MAAKILFVQEDELYRKLFSKFSDVLGVHAVFCLNNEQAESLFDVNLGFDMVVLENQPEIQKNAFFQKLKQSSSLLRLVVLTEDVSVSKALELQNIGIHGVLCKPIERVSFVKTISELLCLPNESYIHE